MKIREDFVTNSSSSSFIIRKRDLTPYQIHQLENVAEAAEALNIDYYGSANDWRIDVTKHKIDGYTSMDNFSMREFLDAIGVDPRVVEWNDY